MATSLEGKHWIQTNYIPFIVHKVLGVKIIYLWLLKSNIRNTLRNNLWINNGVTCATTIISSLKIDSMTQVQIMYEAVCANTLGWLSRLGLQNTPTASLQRGKTSPNECPDYDTKQSDGEAPVMLELLGVQSNPLLPSLPGPLWPRVVAPDRVLSMGQIELNYVLIPNWIVWNRTVFMNKMDLALNNLRWLICHKTKPKQ